MSAEEQRPVHDGDDGHLLAKNQESSPENLALIQAVLNGNNDEVKRWLKNGAKPNYFFRPEDQKNALHLASDRGNTDIIATLLEHGADANCISITTQATPIIFAGASNNPAAIGLLIKAGADTNRVNSYGNTALHEACHAGLIDNCKVLLDNGASVSAENNKGSTPLHTLCYGNYSSTHSIALMELLLSKGADVNARDKHGLTPLLVCCTSNRADFIDKLIEAGANPAVHDSEGKGGYEIAQFYKSEGVIHKFSPVHDAPFSRHIFKL